MLAQPLTSVARHDALADHHVVDVAHQPQVEVVAAETYTATMVDGQPVQYRPVRNLPREPVRRQGTQAVAPIDAVAGHGDLAVTVGCLAPSPD